MASHEHRSTQAATITVEEKTTPTQGVKWAIMGVSSLGVFMSTLDSSIVNISLPTIANDFHVPLNGSIAWVVISYLVASAALLLTAGRLADMIGRKPVWLCGLTLFTASSALCGAAPSLLWLIVARALQGLGSAMMMSISPALVVSAFPPGERGRALGTNAMVVALGISTGPTLGGLITAYASWRWIFYVNIPVGILAIIATLIVLKEPLKRNPGRFDPLGALLLAMGMAGITAGLSFGKELGWNSPLILALLIGGVLALAALGIVERRVANPIIVLDLLKNRVFASAFICLMLNFMALSSVSFMMPFYMEQLRHFPTQVVGLMLTPIPITLAVIAPFSGSLADRVGSRWLAVIGLSMACVGLFCVSQLNEQSTIPDILWRLILTGVGVATFQSPNSSALMGSVPREHQGSASGFLATGRTTGTSLGIAMGGAIFTSLGGAAAGLLLLSQPHDTAQIQMFTNSFHATFLAYAALAAVGAVLSQVRGKEEQRKA
jgi:EmrB/QacA subfamily drug resistance transporter